MIAPEKTSVLLAIGQVLTLSASSDVVGTITELVASIPQTPVAVADGLTKGPFSSPKTYVIEISVGTVTLSAAVAAAYDPAAYATLAAAVAVLQTLHISGTGAPVDYTDGSPAATGEGVVLPGCIYSASNGDVYRNDGTQAEPIWVKLGDAA